MPWWCRCGWCHQCCRWPVVTFGLLVFTSSVSVSVSVSCLRQRRLPLCLNGPGESHAPSHRWKRRTKERIVTSKSSSRTWHLACGVAGKAWRARHVCVSAWRARVHVHMRSQCFSPSLLPTPRTRVRWVWVCARVGVREFAGRKLDAARHALPILGSTGAVRSRGSIRCREGTAVITSGKFGRLKCKHVIHAVGWVTVYQRGPACLQYRYI
jgi:hypothetical protein